MARQKLGQHFLVSEKALDRIAAAACGTGVSLAVEIGSGKGALTAKLLPLAEKLVALEIDPDLVGYQRMRFGDQPHFEIHQQDALHADFAAWPGAVVVGNLPYYVATPIIERVVRAMPAIPRAVFLIQREVAERITAVPGTRAYGYLSTLVQFRAETRLLFRVAPGCFQPPPKVDSAVIELRPRANGVAVADPEDFLRFLALSFHLKRKMLRNNLSERFSKAVLDTIPATAQRAEQMSLDALAALYTELMATAGPAPQA